MRELQPVAEGKNYSRRRDLRIAAPSGLRVTLEPDTPVLLVRDISYGGVCVITRAPLAPKSEHTIRLTLGTTTAIYRARTAHCRPHAVGSWVVGFAFVGAPLSDGLGIETLLNEAVAMASQLPFA